jgi:hypothetical protein
MNSSFIDRLAGELSKSVEGRGTAGEKIRALYRRVFARDPDPEEKALAVEYLRHATVAQYAQALLSTNEVIFWP